MYEASSKYAKLAGHWTNCKRYVSSLSQRRWIAVAMVVVAVALSSSISQISSQADEAAWKQPVENVVVLPGDSPGELQVSWDTHSESAVDYRVAWAPDGESFREFSELDWNAFPTDSELLIANLTPGETYKAKVRARFGTRKSAWSEVMTGTAAEAVPEPPQIVETPIAETAPLVAEQQLQEPAQPDYAADRFYALGIDIQDNFNRYFTYDDSVDVDDDPRDYFSFWLDESTEVNLSLRQLDFNADLFLEDEYGNVLASSENKGTADEDIKATLPDEHETYYIRIESLESGPNNYRFKAKVSDPDPATEVTVPEITGPPVVYVPPPEPVAEPVEDDRAGLRADTCADNNATTCTATINGTFNGNIETANDADRIKVVLASNKSYVFVMKGEYSGNGTLRKVKIFGIYNQSGTLQSNTSDEYSGPSVLAVYDIEARVVFTPRSAGNYYVRVGSFGNDTGTFKLNVKRDEELASNSTTATVAVNGSSSGRIEQRDDKDWFKVPLLANKTYQIDVKGLATGHGSVWDVEIEGIFNSSGSRRHAYVDDGGIGRNARTTFSTGSSGGNYFVAVGNNRYTSTPEGTYRVFVTDVTNGHPDDHLATTSTTATVAVNGTAEGNIMFQNDRDWFQVTLTAGTKYWIEMNTHVLRKGGGGVRAIRSLHDPYIRGIHNSAGDLITGKTNDNGGFYLNSRVVFIPSSTGAYYIAAGAARSPDGYYWEGTYQIEVTTCIPPSCLR